VFGCILLEAKGLVLWRFSNGSWLLGEVIEAKGKGWFQGGFRMFSWVVGLLGEFD
jgi:hypothetical protein